MKDGNMLTTAITVARELHDPDDARHGVYEGSEYSRGQAELICDLFRLPMEPYKEIVTMAITHGITTDRAIELIVEGK